MKRTIFFAAALFTIFLLSSSSFAQTTDTPVTPHGINWVDANGDGICDNFGTANQGANRMGKGYGKKDGTGNPLRPQDGTGYGAKAGKGIAAGSGMGAGTGVCDGTGPKGAARRGGRK